jgi:hypothetical protein
MLSQTSMSPLWETVTRKSVIEAKSAKKTSA